ncbi:hypothetical protein Val02_13600 [Virgisporangium aliadipatigenens]|uniref:LPXTG-motif cell wall anchor domain-containing protein n=1 Tax=Virgisporangium aliadipatigenens TaxID=741659 RepID=A0A8J3YFX1_9ACTN|nr:hypothetical protein [Virgisporangium aliadipatigenens]GIJ44474.1 hypothetical protein Val02_13600 [Virgisporangium aliadipatigenens]
MFTRRMLAVAGAAAIGTLGALTIPSAASAHHLTVVPKFECVGENAVVTWKVTNSQNNVDGKITKAALSQGSFVATTEDKLKKHGVIAVGTVLTMDGDKKSAVGVVTVPASAGKVTVDFAAEWKYKDGSIQRWPRPDAPDDGHFEKAWTKEQCGQTTPADPKTSFDPNCDGTVTVVIDNPAGSKNTEFKVQSQTTDWSTNVTVPAGKKSEPITVSKADAAEIKVSIRNDGNGRALGKYKFAAPADCKDADYTGTFTPDCNGVTVTLTNPADGDTLKVTILANGKEQYKFEVAPGATSEPKKIGRQDKLKVVVKVEGFEPDGEFDYTVPANCGDSLPVTGANAGLMAGGASVLVLGGAALWMVARRRRVQFTA